MIGIRTPLSRGMQELRDPCEGGRCCSSNGLPRHFLLHALEIFVVPLQEYSALLEAPPSNRHELHSEAFVPPIRLRYPQSLSSEEEARPVQESHKERDGEDETIEQHPVRPLSALGVFIGVAPELYPRDSA